MILNIFGILVGLSLLFIFVPRTLRSFGFDFKPKFTIPFGEISKVKNSLSINPSQKHIYSNSGNNWNEEFFVYLINHTDKTFYDINISSEFPDSVDVTFLPEDVSGYSTIGSKTDNITVGADFMIIGKTNTGMKYAQTVINNIGPNERKKVKITVNKKDLNKDFELIFNVSNFSEVPKSILSK